MVLWISRERALTTVFPKDPKNRSQMKLKNNTFPYTEVWEMTVFAKMSITDLEIFVCSVS